MSLLPARLPVCPVCAVLRLSSLRCAAPLLAAPRRAARAAAARLGVSASRQFAPRSRQAAPPPAEEGSTGSILWSLLSGKLGGDVFSAGISLPSWMYEPLTILQRTTEVLEYSSLLDLAAQQRDPLDRLAYVAAFSVSAYSSTHDQRQKTNFNPILGETFERLDKKRDWKYVGEQVSHHPPVSAFHVTHRDWVFWQNSSPTTKFLGNSIDISTNGRSHILFRDGVHFYFTNPATRVHNVILGSMWFEHFGELHITNLATDETCNVTFKKAGIFQGQQFKVEGCVRNAKGEKVIKLEGNWNENFSAQWKAKTSGTDAGVKKEIFRRTKTPDEHRPPYYMNAFSSELLEFSEDQVRELPSTDARRRIDRLFLEMGKTDEATQWKRRLEAQQRADRKARTDEWQPQWFARAAAAPEVDAALVARHPEAFDGMWVFTHRYWPERDTRVAAIARDPDNEALLSMPGVRGTACDFLHYEAAEGDRVTELPGRRSSRTATTNTSPTSTPSVSPCASDSD